ncbi:hypothetical protein VTL71DRAFT_3686 [Oculimacula yallundae]|uniref:Uncharacterized protein n=1 Tax=Oculimacula yallundae TaxID=86028 RepID=A0ABR4C5K2_9HELO
MDYGMGMMTKTLRVQYPLLLLGPARRRRGMDLDAFLYSECVDSYVFDQRINLYVLVRCNDRLRTVCQRCTQASECGGAGLESPAIFLRFGNSSRSCRFYLEAVRASM